MAPPRLPAVACALAALWLAAMIPAPGRAAGAALARCADPGLTPHQTQRFCREALQDGGLGREQRAAVLVNLGVAQAALGRHRAAVRSFGLAIRARPDLALAHTNRARSHRVLGDKGAARADYDRAIALAPRDPDGWFGRGVLRLESGAPEAAADDFNRALALGADPAAARFNLGLAHLRAGAPRRAEAAFTAVIAGEGDDPGAYLNRARARAAGALPGARADFDRAIALAPDWGRAWYARGRYLDAKGAREAANSDFLRAYELGVTDPWLIERVGRITGQ